MPGASVGNAPVASVATGAVAGAAGTIVAALLKTATWTITNTETFEVFIGDFPHEGLTRTTGNNIARTTSLNRQNPILQWLNGKEETLALKSRFRARDITDSDPGAKVDKLVSWSKLDSIVRRPPVCLFMLGTASSMTKQVVIDSVTDIEYSQPTFLGDIREVTFTMNLIVYVPFSIDDTQATDTRYARAREGDYYELLAQQEYGNPMLGVVLRQRSLNRPLLAPADIVVLPSIEGIRTSVPRQQSIPLAGAFGRRQSDTRDHRIAWFKLRGDPYTSFLVNITPRGL